MASISSNSWDARSESFASPAQLQHWQHPNEFGQSPPTRPSPLSSFPPLSPQQQQPPDMRRTVSGQPAAPPPQSHTRTISSFSLFGRKSQPMEATSPPPTSHKQSASVPEFPKPPNVLSRRPSNTPSPSNTNGNTPPPPQPQPQRQPSANPSTGTPANPTPQLHPEIRSIVQLTAAHTRKVYFSGPMVRKVEYQPDGQKPSKDEGWRNVWCQLGGTTLSLWDMKEIEEASKQGRQVPPSYINVTDAFVVVVGNLTTPAPGAPDSTRAYGPVAPGPTETYPNVFSVNTAGLNLLLFSCPSTQALISWVSALRLAAWEKSRLEEMYTAHLIRVMLNDGRETRTPLVRGKMEGWVRIRIAGQTDWKLLWMVISAGVTVQESGSPAPSDNRPTSPSAPRKNRLSQLFSRDHVPTQSTQAGVPSKAQIQVFASPKPKDKKKALLTMQDITQAFAVYPERPELISRSTLIKLEGKFGDEEMAASMRDKEAWLLAMPELEANNTRASEMLKWLIAVHDAFGLYGRPQIYSWDPRDPDSTMFAYPIGPTRDLLFLDRELAETLDPREVQTSAIRRQLRSILWQRMNGSNGSPSEKAQPPIPLEGQPPKIPPLSDIQSRSEQPVASGSRLPSQSPSGAPQISMQIPSLDFDHPSERVPESLPEPPTQSQARSLTPITEASNQPESRSRSSDTAPGLGRSAGHSPAASQPSNSPPLSEESRREQDGASGARVITSPSPSTADSRPFGYRPSEEPHFVVASRPASKQGQYSSPRIPTVAPGSDVDHAANVQLPMSPRNEQPFSPTTAPQPTSPSPKPASVSPPASSQYSQKSLSPPPPVHTPRAPSPPSSVLTSPHSPVSKRFSISTLPYPGSVRSQPFAIQQSVSSDTPSSPAVSYADPVPPPSPAHSSLSSSMQPPAQRREVRREPSEENVLGKEAGALYYMRHIEGDAPPITGPRRLPPPTTDDEEEDEEGSTDSPSLYTPPATSSVNPLNIRKSPSPPPFPPSKASSINVYPGARRGSVDTQGAVTSPTSSILGGARTQDAPSRFGSVAKPGGARARAGSKIASAGTPDQAANTRRGEQQTFQQQPPPSTSFSSSSNSDYGDKKTQEKHDTMPIQQDHSELSYAYDNEPQHGYDDAADAMAALKLLEQDEVPAPQRKTTLPTSPRPAPPAASPSPKPSENSLQSTQQRSSFAPSKSAAERKAKSQAQQAAHHAAVHKPGRANGNKKGRAREAGAWGESSDEEEEEEEDEEDDDEADSDEDLPPRHRAQQQQAMGSPNSAGRAGYSTAPSMQSMPPQQGMSQDMGGYGRRGRELPQVPSHLQGGYEGYMDQQSGRRTLYPNEPPRRQASPLSQMTRPLAENTQHHLPPPPNAPRQDIWTKVLEPGAKVNPQQTRDTFVQIEPPSQTMTKAFTPHGLLSAGLQDKEDRSAKRQEELARETGASLINVPNKPPPPQTGLLGAVAAHEREKKREGGLGATLTEREREKRLAEDRQRKLDDYQKMQLDQMQQGGSMYGGMGYPGFNPMMNPMMANPMMMGMNPMMAGGAWGGYPGMMNPQQMFAAQQAAQAYQHAMMAFSTAGSQVGGEGGQGGAPGGGPAPLNPMMTGGSMFDPRMSMMGMMNPMGMGMGGMSPTGMGGMSPGGMGMQMNPMMGMGMQMTGNGAGIPPGAGAGAGGGAPGQFDSRFMGNFELGGSGPGTPAEGSNPQRSQNSSANGRGSPAVPGPRGSDDQAR